MRRVIIIGFSAILMMLPRFSFSQQTEIIKSYIETYKDLAIAEMQRTGVPASITLAQGIHETMAGTSDLVLSSNNHFGIKCKTGWSGPSVRHDDDLRAECFRKYETPEESYKDHSDFLKTGPRYAFLFSLEPTDYVGWAVGLKRAGYATSPVYSQVLIKLIKDYNLQRFTYEALGMDPNTVEENTADDLSGTTAPELKAPASPTVKIKYYKVRAGETLYGIAKKNKVSLATLKSINGISNPKKKLKPGMRLKIQVQTISKPAAKPSIKGKPVHKGKPAIKSKGKSKGKTTAHSTGKSKGKLQKKPTHTPKKHK
jgi:LysM repeat protein